MQNHRNTWSLVLAAGDGSRLRTLTTTDSGIAIPKQFCSLRSGSSLLHRTLDRARSLSSKSEICVVVAAEHRCWWLPQLDSLPESNIIVQPLNRGTANGILLPLLILHRRDPGANIVILPSDHHVREELILARSMRQALDEVQKDTEDIVLLGIEPEEPDPQLGYIVPGNPDDQVKRPVMRFVEKPTVVEARELIGQGALWNAFIVVSSTHALLTLFSRRVPDIVNAMQAAIGYDLESSGAARAVAKLYRRLPTSDFSCDILTGQSSYLRVLPVRRCGWNDLGTPDRVARALRLCAEQADDGLPVGSSHLSLEAQHRRLFG